MSYKTAFVFPGQGSQSVGMLADLGAAYPVVRRTFEEASEALGRDLWKLAQEGPEEELNRTELTQPAMLAAGVAVWRVWEEQGGPEPSWMAGHSLGEYTALVCAGAIGFGEGVKLVADRGRFMDEAVPAGEGAMSALLGLDNDTVRSVCDAASQGEVVEPVNFNAPGQVVIAGHSGAVERAIKGAREAGAKHSVRLSVSVPSHCELMRPASTRLAERLEGVQIAVPVIPVIHNVDAESADHPDAIRDRLARQVHRPVLWTDTVLKLAGLGVGRVVECGPGRVLGRLAKRIDRSLEGISVYDPASLDEALQRVDA